MIFTQIVIVAVLELTIVTKTNALDALKIHLEYIHLVAVLIKTQYSMSSRIHVDYVQLVAMERCLIAHVMTEQVNYLWFYIT